MQHFDNWNNISLLLLQHKKTTKQKTTNARVCLLCSSGCTASLALPTLGTLEYAQMNVQSSNCNALVLIKQSHKITLTAYFWRTKRTFQELWSSVLPVPSWNQLFVLLWSLFQLPYTEQPEYQSAVITPPLKYYCPIQKADLQESLS